MKLPWPRTQRAAVNVLLLVGLALAACTRSATNIGNVPPSATPLPGGSDGGGGGLVTQQDPTMAALGTAIRMTQTAQALAASGAGGGGEVETPTPTFSSLSLETPTPLPPTATVTVAVAVGGGCPNPYTVKQGEWIYQIARTCQVDPSAIIAANPGINPNFIQPGQQLNMPAPGTGPVPPATAIACTGTHTVVKGENLFRIAYNCGLTTEQLAAFNSIPYPYTIYTGQILRFP